MLWGWVSIAESLFESLWLDELHSVWCASGTSGEVFSRSALGNQLSPYFWLLRFVDQTFGMASLPSDTFSDASPEALWRAPSVVAWLGMVALCGWLLAGMARQSGRSVVVLALLLIVADRLQIFYATEARPYALVALVNLVAWCALARWSSRWRPPAGEARGERLDFPLWLAWCALNSLACWLQPTAVLSVAAQYLFLFVLWITSRPGAQPAGAAPRSVEPRSIGFWPIGLGAILFALSLLPALHVLGPVWEHRQRWAAFASGVGLSDVLLLLPFVALIGPLAAGAIVQRVLALGLLARFPAVQPNHSSPQDSQLRREGWMWLLAWLVPCVAIYLLTASGTAPLMHRRYVFVASGPFVLWIAHSTVRLRPRGLSLAAFAAMLAILLVQQGSLHMWMRGAWPGAVRGEDWRGAVRWINSQTDPERPIVVCCASNLIEGAGGVPQQPLMREYLTLPLRSIYRVDAAGQIVPLANDPASWAKSIADSRGGLSGEQSGEAVWLVVRCSAAGLERRLQMSGLTAGQRRDFGGVQVAGDVGFKKMP